MTDEQIIKALKKTRLILMFLLAMAEKVYTEAVAVIEIDNLVKEMVGEASG